jgi:hypothetical protein
LASDLEANSGALLTSILAPLSRRLPVSGPEPTFSIEEVVTFSKASLQTELGFFCSLQLPERCPEIDADAARNLAQIGALEYLLDWYRSCQVALRQAWLLRVDAAPGSGQEGGDLLRRGEDFFSTYAELLSDWTADIYRRESQRAKLRVSAVVPGISNE